MVDKSGEDGGWRARCTDCRKVWAYQQTHFNGELMICALCDKQQQHVISLDINWRLIQLDGRGYYICPDHFPTDGASIEAFTAAYENILRNLMSRQD